MKKINFIFNIIIASSILSMLFMHKGGLNGDLIGQSVVYLDEHVNSGSVQKNAGTPAVAATAYGAYRVYKVAKAGSKSL